MKRILGMMCALGLACVLVFSVYWCLLPMLKCGPRCGHRELSRFCDFSLRMNEAECLRMGIDPYDVWTERIVMPPYYSNDPGKAVPAGCDKVTNAYVPWEYSFALPFSFLPRWMSWLVYCALMLLSAAFCLVLPLKHSMDSSSCDGTLVSMMAFLVVAYPLWSNAAIGNLAVFSLAGAIGMAWSMNRGKDALAALFWSVVMLKPQLGLPLSIPLLLRLKLKTFALAVVICVALSIPPSLLCGKSPVGLILHAPAASAFAFEGCGTWPKMLCGTFAGSCDIVAGTLVGVVVCTVMTWLVRKEKDWFVFLMPAAITSCCWTYTQAYSHAMGWFVAFVFVRELLRNPQSKFLWTLAALAAVSLTRWFLAWHGLFGFFGWRFPMSEYAFRCVDSLNSTLSLAIAFALCVWIWRRNKESLHE